jgi:hypothetical protein
LTLGQLNAYISSWVGDKKKSAGDGSIDDLELFNITAGIEKKFVKKTK